LHSFLVCARKGTKSNNILIAMPFYQLHLMFIGAVVVLVGGSIAVALAGRRWPPLWRSLIPKHCRCQTSGEDVDHQRRHPGLPGIRRHHWSV
jgi:hypothetical protein